LTAGAAEEEAVVFEGAVEQAAANRVRAAVQRAAARALPRIGFTGGIMSELSFLGTQFSKRRFA
jgi:hypothetical protein